VVTETALGSAIPGEAKERAESDKVQAVARIADLQVQLAAAKAELQPKLDAVTTAREAAVAAEAARVAAAAAARQVMHELSARRGATIRSVIKKSARRLLRSAFLTGDANCCAS
jgi:hypothetical protein